METTRTSLIERFEQFLIEHSLVRKGNRVIVAVSGGVDSMVLMDLFVRIRPSWNLAIMIVHVNHQLRGNESFEDEEFVRAAARTLDLPFESGRIDVARYQSDHRVSKQEAARSLRYEFFERIRSRTASEAVATAHHADDNAETVLMNALRGAGVRGLAGIPVCREPGSVIRPLLFAYRKEIEMYAASAGIRFREDSSNVSLAYTRNLLRHSVMPSLSSELHTDARVSLNRVSAVMRSLGDLLAARADEISGDVFCVRNGMTGIVISSLQSQPLYLREELVLRLLRNLGIEPSFQKVHACLGLCEQPTGHSLDLSGRWRILHDRGHLLFYEREGPEGFEEEVSLDREYEFAGFRFSARLLDEVPGRFRHPSGTEVADADKFGRHLVLRSWKDGDWFVPLGMNGKKKLSDFFINAKIPKTEKHQTPILESDGAIVWVCGLRLDERFRVSSATRRAVELKFERVHPQ